MPRLHFGTQKNPTLAFRYKREEKSNYFFSVDISNRMKYFCSVLAMFKNESMILEEWIKHYLNEGIQQIYLIDNGSDDDSKKKLDPFIKKKQVTYVFDSFRQKVGTQNLLYNKHFLDKVKAETEWIIVCDMDEYFYAKDRKKTIKDFLTAIPSNVHGIMIPWLMYGSNKLDKQPTSVKKGFTKREKWSTFLENLGNNPHGKCKTIVRTSALTQLETHKQVIQSSYVFPDRSALRNLKEIVGPDQPLRLNHYTHMSMQYYTDVKCKRGGGQGASYDLDRFKKEDKRFNEIEDKALCS